MSGIIWRLAISSIYYGGISALLAALLYALPIFVIFGHIDFHGCLALAFLGCFFGIVAYLIAFPWV